MNSRGLGTRPVLDLGEEAEDSNCTTLWAAQASPAAPAAGTGSCRNPGTDMVGQEFLLPKCSILSVVLQVGAALTVPLVRVGAEAQPGRGTCSSTHSWQGRDLNPQLSDFKSRFNPLALTV